MESSRRHIIKVRKKRTLRVRKHLKGSAEKPRLCVVKTNQHIHVQIIDDNAGVTLASTSTIAKQFRNTEHNRKNKASAAELGKHIAELAVAQNVSAVVFDRGPHKYHGVIAAVAEAARAGGLQF